MSEIHGDRREPATPQEPLELSAAGDELLETAASMSSRRASRTLTPGAHAPLKQTLVALRAGVGLSEHRTNGPATIHVLRGHATINTGTDSIEVAAGQWSVVPSELHDLQTGEDTVVLITVARAMEP